jgi:septal ring factor EnvC (AmiA/AmiB activator)
MSTPPDKCPKCHLSAVNWTQECFIDYNPHRRSVGCYERELSQLRADNERLRIEHEEWAREALRLQKELAEVATDAQSAFKVFQRKSTELEAERDFLRQQLAAALSREAALRVALEKAHPAEIWDKARMYYTHETSFKGPDPILQWHADLCKAVDAALASDGKGGAA